jgi:hypothetical protein
MEPYQDALHNNLSGVTSSALQGTYDDDDDDSTHDLHQSHTSGVSMGENLGHANMASGLGDDEEIHRARSPLFSGHVDAHADALEYTMAGTEDRQTHTDQSTANETNAITDDHSGSLRNDDDDECLSHAHSALLCGSAGNLKRTHTAMIGDDDIESNVHLTTEEIKDSDPDTTHSNVHQQNSIDSEPDNTQHHARYVESDDHADGSYESTTPGHSSVGSMHCVHGDVSDTHSTYTSGTDQPSGANRPEIFSTQSENAIIVHGANAQLNGEERVNAQLKGGEKKIVDFESSTTATVIGDGDATSHATDDATLSSAARDQTQTADENTLQRSLSRSKDMDSDEFQSEIPTQIKRRRLKDGGDGAEDVVPKKSRMHCDGADMAVDEKVDGCDASVSNANSAALGAETQTQTQYICIDS